MDNKEFKDNNQDNQKEIENKEVDVKNETAKEEIKEEKKVNKEKENKEENKEEKETPTDEMFKTRGFDKEGYRFVSFKDKVRIAVKDVEDYIVIATTGARGALSYIAQLTLLVSLIITPIIMLVVSGYTNQFIDVVLKDNKDSKVANFYVENDKFVYDSEEDFNFQIKDKFNLPLDVMITNKEYDAKIEKTLMDAKNIMVIINKDYISVKTAFADVSNIPYGDMFGELAKGKFTKADLYKMMKQNDLLAYKIVSGLTIFITLYVAVYMSLMMLSFMISIIGYLASRIMLLPLKYSSIFAMATASITLSTFFGIIYVVLRYVSGIYIKDFAIVSEVIAIIYMIMALIMMKTEIINNISKLAMKRQDDVGGYDAK